ncbi:hypothetical protein [Aerosakkonema funiforme]|uniref:hypothetical protein n=1 Tax=Aerosakkonema funiforme TaxID=1246630 RepID=UPI0035BA53BF
MLVNNPFDLNPDENWSPEEREFIDGELIIEPSFYNGHLIKQPRKRWTQEEQLELLDWHPLFTGRCPGCEMPCLKYEPSLVWECQYCGWKDCTV